MTTRIPSPDLLNVSEDLLDQTIESALAEVRAANPRLTKAQAVSQVFGTHTALYDAHLIHEARKRDAAKEENR